MKKVFIFIIAFFLHFVANAQDLPVLMPPSPEATSLAKFTEIPVSYYTGIPSIRVPLHSINFDGLDIPIGLSYHARGIKVEEVASRIGIGWALNAGGTITRQIRGRNDFNANGHGYLQQNFYETFNLQSTRTSVYNNDVIGDADLVPDQFSFNFLGYSGKFIFDQKTKNPILQSYDDLKIENFGETHFIITTSNGFKFYFGASALGESSREARDRDINLENFSVDNDIISSSQGTGGIQTGTDYNTWHLIDIVSPNGKKISFNYTLEKTNFYRRSYDQRKNNINSSYYSRNYGEQYQLHEIIFENTKVKFIKAPSKRLDLGIGTGVYLGFLPKTLSSVEVENNYKRIKKYNFTHSYSTDNTSGNENVSLITLYPSARNRLFLDVITKVDANGVIKPHRLFEYTDKNSLPNRFSNSQDIWGYYNGKSNGRYLTFMNYDSSFSIDRKVDSVKAMVGLINKVTYPTGGYSKYIFEPNKAMVPGYFKNLLFQDPNPVPISETKVANLTNNSMNPNGLYETPVFSIDSSAFGTMNLNVSCLDFNNNCSGYSFSILNVDTNQSTIINLGTNNNNYPLLPLGNYKLVAHPSGSSNGAFSVTLQWNKALSTQDGLVFSGGNRIKKIENYSVDNGKITRSYEYLKENGQSSGLVFSLPSYYFIVKDVFINGVLTPVKAPLGARPGSPITYEQGNHVGYSRVTEYIDSDTEKGKGGKTEYEFTAMPDGGEFYKAPYTLPVNNEWLRGKPLAIKHYKRNLNSGSYNIIKMDNFVYKYADNMNYNFLTNNLLGDPFYNVLDRNIDRLQYNLPLIVFKLDERSLVHSNANQYKKYNLNGGVQKLSAKQETVYYENGNSMTNTTNYFYNYDKHYQISKTKTTNSTGDVFFSKMYYPEEIISQTFLPGGSLSFEEYTNINELKAPIPSGLNRQHRVSIPIQTDSYKDINNNGLAETSELLSRQRTIFLYWGNNIFSPKSIQTSKGTSPLEDRIVYHNYDNKGNPTEVSKKEGSKIYYVWGYNQTQPIAKIEGYTDTQLTAVQAKINTAITASNNDSTNATEDALRTALKAIRDDSNMSEALVTSFTYDPLIGVTSITDPRGQTIYYEYDEFNRLKHVKDNEGNILSKNEYNYKN